MIGYLNVEEENALMLLKQKLLDELNVRLIMLVLYGSKAKGDYTKDSDIDLLVVVDELDAVCFKTISRVVSEVEIEFGIEFSVVPYGFKDYSEQLKSGINPFVLNISR